MQEVTEEELEQLIEEAKKAGKDVSELEAQKGKKTRAAAASPPQGERKEKKVSGGKRVIESTGPAKEEDFK
jgi:hypothetical protein